MPILWSMVLLSSWLVPAAGVGARPISAFIPSDSAVWIQVEGVSQWGPSMARDQIGRMILQAGSISQFVASWQQMQAMLNLTSQEMLQRYFGRSVAIVAPRTGHLTPIVLLTQVAPRVGQELVRKLELSHLAEKDAFSLYQTPDLGAIVAISDHDNLMAITASQNRAYLDRVLLTPEHESNLASQRFFKKWSKHVPPKTCLRGIIRPAAGQIHRFFIASDEKGITAHYVGRLPQYDAWLKQLGDEGAPQRFGPLPVDTIAALSLNIHNPNPPEMPRLDAFLKPQTYREDIAPKLGQSLVLFIGKPSSQQIVPTLGIALEMRDAFLASYLDQYMKNMMLIATMSMRHRSQNKIASATPRQRLVASQLVRHKQCLYHTATLGNLQMRGNQHKIVAPIHLTWGRVGRWYIISTNEKTFRDCVDQCQLQSQSPPTSKVDPIRVMIDKKRSPVQTIPRTNTSLVQLRIKPGILASHLRQVIRLLNQSRDAKVDVASQKALVDQVHAISQALEQYKLMQLILSRNRANQLVGDLTLDRK